MQISVLEEIMFGQFTVEDRMVQGKAYKKLNDKCFKLYDELKSELSEEQGKKLDDFINKNTEVEYEDAVAYFKLGFKLAFRIAAECFSET